MHYAFGLRSAVMLEVDEDPSPEKVEKLFKRRVVRRPVDVGAQQAGGLVPHQPFIQNDSSTTSPA